MERTCPNAPRKVNPTKQIRYRRFVFTLNNYTQEEYSWIIESFAPSIQWIIVAKETGTNGTPHLQGACVIGKQLTLSYLKTSVGFKRAHLEPMHGKPQDSLAYCTKQDLHAFVRGELPTEGKRKDIHAITSRIRQGSTLSDLIEDDVGAEAIVKYYRGLTVLRSLCRKQRDPKKAPCVIWLHGPTGSGKTRSAFSSAMSFAGGVDDIWLSSGGLQWFGGYDGQRVAIFDDFRAKHAPDFSFLLRVTDRYPLRVPFKGGEVEWGPSVIIFTAPKDPEECFSVRKEHRPEDVGQLLRRITRIIPYDAEYDESMDTFREQLILEVIRESGVWDDESDLADDSNTDRVENVLLTQ